MDNLLTKKDQITHEHLREGCLLLVDKPISWTSFDVVNKLRFSIKRKLDIKKYKVGHAGTLDPLASGLLLICISKYTKRIQELVETDKEYTGQMKLGCTTPSYDSETPVDVYFPEKLFSDRDIFEATTQFLGESKQLPPMYSAIKRSGVPLYKLARKGVKLELEPRSIRIDRFSCTCINLPFISFDIKCTKGTYIRSLVHDFGMGLKSGAHLTQLRRTFVGSYSVDDSWALTDLIYAIDEL